MSNPWSICSNSPEDNSVFETEEEQTQLGITEQDVYDTNSNLEVAFAQMLLNPNAIPGLTRQESDHLEWLRNPTKPEAQDSFQNSFDRKPDIYKTLEPHFSSSYPSAIQFYTPREVLMTEFVRSNSINEQFFQPGIVSVAPSPQRLQENSPCSNSSSSNTSSTVSSPESDYRTDGTLVCEGDQDTDMQSSSCDYQRGEEAEWGEQDVSSECSSPDSASSSFSYSNSTPDNHQHRHTTTAAVRPINSPRRRNLNSAKLWEWILHLLLKPHKYQHVVSWENREQGLFKIHNERELTKLYNSYKNTVESRGGRQQPSRARNPATGIKYESILRALRHCYKTRVMVRVNRKHKYEFGPNAHEWQLGLTRVNAIKSIERWEDHFSASRHFSNEEN